MEQEQEPPTTEIRVAIGDEYEGAFLLNEEVDMTALRKVRDNFPEVYRRMDGEMGFFNGTAWVPADEKQAWSPSSFNYDTVYNMNSNVI